MAKFIMEEVVFRLEKKITSIDNKLVELRKMLEALKEQDIKHDDVKQVD